MFEEKGIVITETLLKLPQQTITLAGITSVRIGCNPVYPEASGEKVLIFMISFILLESFFFLVMVANFGFWFMGVNPLAVLRGIGSGERVVVAAIFNVE